MHPNTSLCPPWPMVPWKSCSCPFWKPAVIPTHQLLLPIMNSPGAHRRESCACPLPALPPGKPHDDTIHHCHPRLDAPGPARRNAAHSSVEPLMIASSGKPSISLLSGQKNKTRKPARTLGDCGLIFYGRRQASGTRRGIQALLVGGSGQEFWLYACLSQ